MTHSRFALGFTRNRKVFGLSDAAFRLYVSAVDWSREQRTDGVLTEKDMPAIPRLPRSWRASAVELVGAGLWEAIENGWRIVDWCEPEETELSAKRAEAGRKGGLAKASKQRIASVATEVATGVAKPTLAGGSATDPSLSPTPPLPNSTGLDLSDSESSPALSSSSEPVRLPAREPQSEVKASRKAKRTPAPEASEFVPSEATIKCAREVGAHLKTELVACFDHHRGKGSLMADWQAVVRTWLRSPFRTTQSSTGRREQNPPGYIPFEQRPESRRFDQPAPRRGGPPTLAFGGTKT